MVRWDRLLSPAFLVSLFAFLASTVAAVILRATVITCTVGFNDSSSPISARQAGSCPTYEYTSAVLVAVALAGATFLVWLAARLLTSNHVAEEPGTPIGGASNVGGRNEPSRRSSVIRRLRAWPSYTWVCLLIAVFFGATFFAASWQYLHAALDSNDLAINQQALSSTLLGGKPYIFYEAINCGRHGQCSFLQVHQAFIAYGVALVYGVAPTPFTLFAIQSLVLGMAALPLYAITRDITRSQTLSVVVAAVYVVWTPLFIMAARDSFHWEAFLPVELLTVFWLWNRKWYLLAAPAVLLAFVTEEVTPVLIFFIGLFFLAPWLGKGTRLFLGSLRASVTGPRTHPSRLRLFGRWLGLAFRVPEVYASLLLMAGSVAAYILLRLFAIDGGWLIGVPPVPPAYALPLNSPNKVFVFSYAAFSDMWTSKVMFWIVVYLTLGFVPLFAPRALILVLPWVGFSFFNITKGFWLFGNQYIFVPTAAIFIGFAYGVNRISRWSANKTAESRPVEANRTYVGGMAVELPTSVTSARRWRRSRSPTTDRGPARAIIVGAVLIIGGNLLLNPLNPYSADVLSDFGAPFAYNTTFSYAPPANDQPLQRLISLIPMNAIVTAPPSIYSMVADDPYAYPMVHFENPPYNVSLLPGNESSRLQYVLLPYSTPGQSFDAPPLGDLYDRSEFGVRGCVGASTVGGVELFQRGYTGNPQEFGPADPLCPNYFSGDGGLVPGEHDSVEANTSSPSGIVIQSTPCSSNKPYSVWSGPGIGLPAGNYSLHAVFAAFNASNVGCTKSNLNPARGVMSINVTGQNSSGVGPIYYHEFTLRYICSGGTCSWNFWNVTFNLPLPTNDIQISGTVTLPQFIVQVAYVLLLPSPA